MKTKTVIVTTSAATLRGTFNESPEPQEMPADLADEFVRQGWAMTPGQARKTADGEVETTTRRGRPKKETTAK